MDFILRGDWDIRVRKLTKYRFKGCCGQGKDVHEKTHYESMDSFYIFIILLYYYGRVGP